MPLSLTEASAICAGGCRRDGRAGLKAACLPHWPRAFSKKLAHSPKLRTPAGFATRANPSLIAHRCQSEQPLGTHVAIARPPAPAPWDAWEMPLRCDTWPCEWSARRVGQQPSMQSTVQVHRQPTRRPVQSGQRRVTTHALRLARSLSQSFACQSPTNGTCSDAYWLARLGALRRLGRLTSPDRAFSTARRPPCRTTTPALQRPTAYTYTWRLPLPLVVSELPPSTSASATASAHLAPSRPASWYAAELALAANRPMQDSWVTNPPSDSRCDKGKPADRLEPAAMSAYVVRPRNA